MFYNIISVFILYSMQYSFRGFLIDTVKITPVRNHIADLITLRDFMVLIIYFKTPLHSNRKTKANVKLWMNLSSMSQKNRQCLSVAKGKIHEWDFPCVLLYVTPA